jgi:phage repressor protein C with HTH and peptisase S24 domain
MVTALGLMLSASANFFLLPKNLATSCVFITNPRLSCSNLSMLKYNEQATTPKHSILKLRMLNICGMDRNQRIARAIQLSGKKKGEIAKACAVANSAVTQWIDGTSKSLRPENLYALATATGFNAEWLAIGEGPERKPEANAELIGAMSAWDSLTPLGDDEVAIPLYKEVELAAGCGTTEVIEVPGRLLRFAKSTLREAGVQESNAVCATIKGRSMERLIMDGATIGIDTGSKHIEDGEIYAFDQDGMLRIKYLYRLPGGGVRVRSENDEEFPDETLTAEQFATIRMLGWVFWWSTVRRRRGLSIAK